MLLLIFKISTIAILIACMIAAVLVSIHVFRSLRKNGVDDNVKAFCPGCKSELVSNGAFIGYTERELAVFECRACKVESYWDFDPPVPILIKPRGPEAGSGTTPR